ncbi:MAG TPA: sulfite exporter TauE/SafE family protein [Methylomirabilota bacterium]|nr:sulfite exporter TauE/SafE family protein [Methylomirabilota bacterium]
MTLLAAATSMGLGFLIGAFGTLVGAGGGFLLVPLLVLGYGFAPADAVGTSLSLVFLNALSGSVAYLRQRRVDLSLGWRFAAATLPGAVGGAYLTRALSTRAFVVAFGLILLAIATLLFIGIQVRPSARAGLRSIVDTGGEAHHYRVDVWKGVVVSFAVGVLSSVFGIGGGIIHVPFLIVALGLPVHVATATSHFVLSISAFAGAMTFLSLGHVRLATTALMGVGILAGAQLGALASTRASANLLRRVLAGSLSLVGARMLFDVLR